MSMKTNRQLSLLLCLAINGLATLDAAAQSAPSLVNYQGKLTDAGGNPLPNGLYGVAFRIWNKKAATDSGNLLIWGQEYNVAVQNGVFNVILGSAGGTPVTNAAVLDIGFAFGESERFIGLTVTRSTNGTVIAGASEVVPRQQVLSSPYAFNGVPKGAVIMWSGSLATIPSGWSLCDGSNGTPDLRDRFVLGAGGQSPVAGSGGSTTHSHAAGSFASQAHTHTVPYTGWGEGPHYNDTHSGWLVTHSHHDPIQLAVAANENTTSSSGGAAISGVSAPASSLPPFYTLAFIIKL